MTSALAPDTLTVCEVFGPTFQGEGPSAGQRAGFVRLGRCNLSCGWCDSRFTWDWAEFNPAQELIQWSTGALLSRLDDMHVTLVVLTGGEPLLQQRRLRPLLEGFAERGWRVEIETNGVLAPLVEPGLVAQWNVSPKLANSGIRLEQRYRPDVLQAFEATGRAVFKFVVVDQDELDEVAAIVGAGGLSKVWIMPEGTDAATVTARLKQLAEPVLARGWQLTPRLQVLVWGSRRGV